MNSVLTCDPSNGTLVSEELYDSSYPIRIQVRKDPQQGTDRMEIILMMIIPYVSRMFCHRLLSVLTGINLSMFPVNVALRQSMLASSHLQPSAQGQAQLPQPAGQAATQAPQAGVPPAAQASVPAQGPSAAVQVHLPGIHQSFFTGLSPKFTETTERSCGRKIIWGSKRPPQ